MNTPATMSHANLQTWLAEAGNADRDALAAACDDLADGLIVCPESGFENAHELVFQLRSLGLEVHYFSASDCAAIRDADPDARPFYMCMTPETRAAARAMHGPLLKAVFDGLLGDQDD